MTQINSHADEIIAAETDRFAQSNLTSMVPPSIFGKEWAREQPPAPVDLSEPEKPTVWVTTTVTVDLNRNGHGEVYTWTREEALLIRNALNNALGDLVPLHKPGVRSGLTMGPDYRNGNLQS